MDWFLYDNGLRHERVKEFLKGTVMLIEKAQINDRLHVSNLS